MKKFQKSATCLDGKLKTSKPKVRSKIVGGAGNAQQYTRKYLIPKMSHERAEKLYNKLYDFNWNHFNTPKV